MLASPFGRSSPVLRNIGATPDTDVSNIAHAARMADALREFDLSQAMGRPRGPGGLFTDTSCYLSSCYFFRPFASWEKDRCLTRSPARPVPHRTKIDDPPPMNLVVEAWCASTARSISRNRFVWNSPGAIRTCPNS